jgi:hypothetical protein
MMNVPARSVGMRGFGQPRGIGAAATASGISLALLERGAKNHPKEGGAREQYAVGTELRRSGRISDVRPSTE